MNALSPPMGLALSDPSSGELICTSFNCQNNLYNVSRVKHVLSVAIITDLTLTVDHTITVFKTLFKAREDWYFVFDGHLMI